MKFARKWLFPPAALIIGVTLGAAWPPPPLPKLSSEEATWSLPASDKLIRHTPQHMSEVTAGLRWNGVNGPAANAQQAWRLAGILSDELMAVLVSPESEPAKLQRFAIGDLLPDGSQLKDIQGDRIITQNDSCLITYQLFHSKPIDRSEACPVAATNDQGNLQ